MTGRVVFALSVAAVCLSAGGAMADAAASCTGANHIIVQGRCCTKGPEPGSFFCPSVLPGGLTGNQNSQKPITAAQPVSRAKHCMFRLKC